jgi:divalent metal cation (Fe/Co/Zn/Cd) transporter
MTIEEITKDSGLTIELAELAKQRRKIGPYLIGDLHVVVDADLTVRDSGKIAYEIEELVKKEFDEVIEIKVRIDPDEPIPN